MINNRFFLTLLLAILVHLGLSNQQTAHAATHFPKAMDKVTPGSALRVTASSCQGTVTDAAYALMTLAVTEELAAELNALIANGEIPFIAVRSQVEFLTSGSGSAGYQGQIEVYIDRADGNRIELGQASEQHVSALSITMTDVIISSYLTTQVMPGDNISVEVTGQGFAAAGGCGPDDEAGVLWEVTSALCNNEVLPDQPD